MMKKILSILTFSLLFATSILAQSMSDNQVIEYVKSATEAGKSQKQIMMELAARGVSRAQAERIKENYEDKQASEQTMGAIAKNRQRRNIDASEELVEGEMDQVVAEMSDPTEQSTAVAARLVYGRNIFNSRALTFAPSQNLPTPINYKLGPGDEVIIDIWGVNQITYRETISPEGSINISEIGPIYLNGMNINEDGLDLTNWREDLKTPMFKFGPENVDDIIKFVKEKKPLNPVFVDCTASYDLPDRYLDILNAGMSIATPNKRANSKNIEFYHELRRVANKMHRRFLYETNVGAGLPIIDTLQNLYKSGDKLTSFNGIMSGSLSYIFGKLDEGVSFSKAVLEAKELRYTEPDPRDDLSGMDVARKALIIARESGYDIELDDIKMLKVFPDSFDSSGTVEEFLAKLPEVDKYFEEKIANLKKEGKVLRMGATIKDGDVSVGMMEVTQDDPLFSVRGGENAFVFYTERYQPIPLTVRGYGAGAGVTAAGVFGDILRTVSFNPDSN